MLVAGYQEQILDSANEETRRRAIVLRDSYAKYAKLAEVVVVDDEEFLFGDVNKYTRPFPLTATMDPRSMLELAVYHVSLAHHGNRGFLPCGRKSLNDDLDVPPRC